MIYINPQTKGNKIAKICQKNFPKLYDETGKKIQDTFIYSFFNDIIVQSVEDKKTIQAKIKEYILHKIQCLQTENQYNNIMIQKLKELL